MILDFLEMVNYVEHSKDAHTFIAHCQKHQKMEKTKLAFLIYCNSLHKLQGCANTTKRPSRWLDLDILESIGPKE